MHPPASAPAPASSSPGLTLVQAPQGGDLTHSGWQMVEFISDLHLCAEMPQTFAALDDYLARTQADALFVLGDLFELWIGDDAAMAEGANPFYQQCITLFQQASRQRPVYYLHGNRDFLMGGGYLHACGMTQLADPAVLSWGPRRYLLSHGDGACTADKGYMAFRAQVRDPAWMRAFLARPVQERLALARHMREQSQEHQKELYNRAQSWPAWADVQTDAAVQMLQAAHAEVLIHGHTHRPGAHTLPEDLQRWVLSDWDCDHAQTPRAEALRLHASGAHERVPCT